MGDFIQRQNWEKMTSVPTMGRKPTYSNQHSFWLQFMSIKNQWIWTNLLEKCYISNSLKAATLDSTGKSKDSHHPKIYKIWSQVCYRKTHQSEALFKIYSNVNGWIHRFLHLQFKISPIKPKNTSKRTCIATLPTLRKLSTKKVTKTTKLNTNHLNQNFGKMLRPRRLHCIKIANLGLKTSSTPSIGLS